MESVYSFRDRYFENHKLEDAVNKNSEIEHLLEENLEIFNNHDKFVRDCERARYLYLKGKLLNVVPKYDKHAENLLSKAIKLNPKLLEAWNELGECYWKNDDLKKSVSCFEGALKEVLCIL